MQDVIVPEDLVFTTSDHLAAHKKIAASPLIHFFKSQVPPECKTQVAWKRGLLWFCAFLLIGASWLAIYNTLLNTVFVLTASWIILQIKNMSPDTPDATYTIYFHKRGFYFVDDKTRLAFSCAKSSRFVVTLECHKIFSNSREIQQKAGNFMFLRGYYIGYYQHPQLLIRTLTEELENYNDRLYTEQ